MVHHELRVHEDPDSLDPVIACKLQSLDQRSVLRHVVGGRTDLLRDLSHGDQTARSQERTNRRAAPATMNPCGLVAWNDRRSDVTAGVMAGGGRSRRFGVGAGRRAPGFESRRFALAAERSALGLEGVPVWVIRARRGASVSTS